MDRPTWTGPRRPPAHMDRPKKAPGPRGPAQEGPGPTWTGPRRPPAHVDRPKKAPGPHGPAQEGPRPTWTGPRRPRAHMDRPKKAPGPRGPAQEGPRPIWTGPRRPRAHVDRPKKAPGPHGPAQEGPRPTWTGPRRPRAHMDRPKKAPGPRGPAQEGPGPTWTGPRRPPAHVDRPKKAPGPHGPAQEGPRPTWTGPRRPRAHMDRPKKAPGPRGPAQEGPGPTWTGPRRPPAQMDRPRPAITWDIRAPLGTKGPPCSYHPQPILPVALGLRRAEFSRPLAWDRVSITGNNELCCVCSRKSISFLFTFWRTGLRDAPNDVRFFFFAINVHGNTRFSKSGIPDQTNGIYTLFQTKMAQSIPYFRLGMPENTLWGGIPIWLIYWRGGGGEGGRGGGCQPVLLLVQRAREGEGGVGGSRWKGSEILDFDLGARFSYHYTMWMGQTVRSLAKFCIHVWTYQSVAHCKAANR